MGDRAFLVWSLTNQAAAAGLATTLTASGNSGAWSNAVQNKYTSVDLRWADDFWLSVSAATVTGTTPSLTVSLNAFDGQGNLFPLGFSAPALTAAGQKVAFGGRHGGGGAGTYFVASEWGQVAWAITGTTPSFQGVEIALYAR